MAQAAEVGDALLDGEIVAFVDGRPSFERLQPRMHVRARREVAAWPREAPVTFVVFDVLRRFGVDLTGRPTPSDGTPWSASPPSTTGGR